MKISNSSAAATVSSASPDAASSYTKAPVPSAEAERRVSVNFDGFDSRSRCPAGHGAPASHVAEVSGFEQAFVEELAQELLAMMFTLGLAEAVGGASSPAPSGATSGTDSSAATGGLQKSPEGWPAGSVRTPGGYTVVPEGKEAAFSIYGPGQSPNDKPTTRVWGDPHVKEADGTKWDFTKDSNFRLPDGTMLAVDTTSEKGQSVTQRVDIVSGNEHVSMAGINSKTPETSGVGKVPAEVKARLAQVQDTFSLQTEGAEVQWFRSRGNQIEGLITGSRQDAEKTYDQVIDSSLSAVATQASSTAPLGTRDFEQQLIEELRKLLSESPAPQASACRGLGEVKELLAAVRDLAKVLEVLAAPHHRPGVAA